MRTLFKSCNLSEQTHDHLNGCAADGTTTTLTFHLVSARLREAPVPTWHKRAPLIALCDEADFAVVAVGGRCHIVGLPSDPYSSAINSVISSSQTTAQTQLALTLLLHLCFVTLFILLRSRVLQSRVFSVPVADYNISGIRQR